MNSVSLLRICHYRVEWQRQGKVCHIFHLALSAVWAQGAAHEFFLYIAKKKKCHLNTTIVLLSPLVCCQTQLTEHQSLLADLLSEDHGGEPRKPAPHNSQNNHKSFINIRGGVGFNLQLGFSFTLTELSKAYSYSLGSAQAAFLKLLQGKAKRINAETIAFKPQRQRGTWVQAQFQQMIYAKLKLLVVFVG